jgi:NADPH:quinone reductase-like Zn-dependent oxidoreductase
VRAIVITKHGPPDVLQVQERPDPAPGPGQVRIRVRAAGINFADLLARTGLYQDAPKPPCVVGYEVGGVVDAVGEGVESPAVGDRVMAGCRFGGYAELVVADAASVFPLPDEWGFTEGAAFPVAYGTAYAGLVRYGALREGERVLIQAAAGGVGIAATQVAKLARAGEIFGTSSPGKHEAIRGFGVDHPIDYTGGDVAAKVRAVAGEEQPLDLVMDAIGGRSFKESFSLLRPGGRLICFGASAVGGGDKRNILQAVKTLARMPRFKPVSMMSDSKSVIGLNMLRLWDAKGSLDELVGPLRDWAESGAIRPVLSEGIFRFTEGPEAHRYIQERRNVGKVVLVP